MPDHFELAKATFNAAWELLDKSDRTEADEREMLAHAAASWYHWREVGEPKNRSVSDWQMARVLTVLGSSRLARSFGQACLEIAEEANLAPFYVAMAHEALARAAMVGGDDATKNHHIARAKELRAQLTDPEEIEILDGDLADLQ